VQISDIPNRLGRLFAAEEIASQVFITALGAYLRYSGP
jgi:hypothetical protein